jgi:hypothetical protein
VVLGILQVIMQVTGRFFAYLDGRGARQTSKLKTPKELTPEETAAVAVALHLYDKK